MTPSFNVKPTVLLLLLLAHIRRPKILAFPPQATTTTTATTHSHFVRHPEIDLLSCMSQVAFASRFALGSRLSTLAPIMLAGCLAGRYRRLCAPRTLPGRARNITCLCSSPSSNQFALRLLSPCEWPLADRDDRNAHSWPTQLAT